MTTKKPRKQLYAAWFFLILIKTTLLFLFSCSIANCNSKNTIRFQNALENLLFINDKDKNVVPFLVNSLTNHKWQFSKFGREKIRLLLKNQNIRTYLETLMATLNKEESLALGKLLREQIIK